jgi:hypothetical protein
LLQGFGQIRGSLPNFFEQPHILNGDCRLVGESFDKGNLLRCEWPDFEPIDKYDAQQVIAFENWHSEHCPDRLNVFRPKGVLGIGLHIGDVDCSAFERGAT